MKKIKNIYNDGILYDDIHWWKKNDMSFWTNIISDLNPKNVLELACGTGRLSNIFVRENINYTGIDNVANFIDTAKNKMKYARNQANFIFGDMKNFTLHNKFDLIFIGFNSFLHLLTDADISKCFLQVQKHMHKQSHFIIDVFVPNPLFLYKPVNFKSKVLEFIDSKKNLKIYVEEANNYNPNTDINEITWFFSTDNMIDYDIRRFSLRMLFPSKMNQLLIDHGFDIQNQWGDYNQQNLNVNSTLQIYDVMYN